jgi:hypothetical protein
MSQFKKVMTAIKKLDIRSQVLCADDGKRLITATIGGMRTRFQLLAYVNDAESILVVMGLSACRIPSGALPEVIRLANRINPELTHGALCINEDADLVFKAASYFADSNVDDVVRNLIAVTALVFDRYEPAFNSVIYANTPAEDAIKHVL